MIPVFVLISVALHLGIAVFQVLLAAGKPWGEYAWGGQNKGVLPKGYRVGSAIAVFVLIAFAVINLASVGYLRLPAIGISKVALQWIVTIYAALGTVMNAISRSRHERLLWTPVAAILAVLNAAILWRLYRP
jgi:hypothetical protein